MKIRIALPKNDLADKLVENAETVKRKRDVEIYRMPERKILEGLAGDRIEIAAISPATYGMAVEKCDLRIIPGPAIALIGYTGTASVFFKKDLKEIKTVASNFEEDFLSHIGAALLGEKFDMTPRLKQTRENSEEALKTADAAITRERSDGLDSALDVGEEWFDAYEMPLPATFWVCRADAEIPDLEALVKELASDEAKGEKEIIEPEKEGKPYLERKGSILWEWNEDFENALEQVLHFLFYRQIIDAIPKIKVLGREDEEEDEKAKKEEKSE